MATNQVILILLGVWSVGFWISGWVANRRRRMAKGTDDGEGGYGGYFVWVREVKEEEK